MMSMIISRVVLPLFASRADDPEATRRGFRMANSVVMLINVPVMTGLIILPDLVIETLFGSKWLPAAPILAILAVGGIIFPLHVINLHVLLARGGSRTFFQIEVVKKVVGIGCIAVGSLFGLVGLAWSSVLTSALALCFNAWPARRALNYGPMTQLWDLRGIMFCSSVMAVATLLARRVVTLPAPLELASLTCFGALLYFGCGFAMRLRSFAEAWSIVKLMIKRPSAVASSDSAIAPGLPADSPRVGL